MSLSFDKDKIKEVLLTNGYPVKEFSGYITTAALWRGGKDYSSVVIYYNDNICIDYVESKRYSIEDFLAIVANLKTKEEVEALSAGTKSINQENVSLSKIVMPKLLDKSILNDLIPKYDYFIHRGISEKTLEESKCGFYNGNIKYLKNRVVFPCFNSKGELNMIAGRDVTGANKIYWLLKGEKTKCVYPAFLNRNIIREKNSVFLVEGIGDYLTLCECGIKNVLVLFGTEINLSIINFLLKINIGKIYVSTNNDALRGENNTAGNEAADKICRKLHKYFNYNQIFKVLPSKYKDWNIYLLKNQKQQIIEELKNYV